MSSYERIMETLDFRFDSPVGTEAAAG